MRRRSTERLKRRRVKAGEWPEVGRLMYASHASLREDFEVSCSELDLLSTWPKNRSLGALSARE